MNAVVQAAPLAACPHCGEAHPAHVLRCPDTDIILPLAGRMLDGRFRFIELIGRGGMASVWLARNERVDRLVAIKLIRPEVARDDDMVARFRAEARAAGRIGHPNICDILDSGRSPIGPYIVMEYLRGRSLGELLADCGRLAPPVAVMIVREALRGLGAAHKAGIVHRDLKPENLFLHRPETGDPTVKIMDFGVAKFIDGTGEVRTEHGALLGTPEYMAPEQFRGAAHAEPRTDIWAVGAILYRAITGRNAFGGPTVAATLLMVSSEEATPMDALVPDVPPGLVRIVTRCLSKPVVERYADTVALDAALAPFTVRERDLSPWDPATEPSGDASPVPSEGSRPTSPWTSKPKAAPATRSRSSRWWVAALGLFVGAGAFAWARDDRVEPPGPETIATNDQRAVAPTEPNVEPTIEPTIEAPPTIVEPTIVEPNDDASTTAPAEDIDDTPTVEPGTTSGLADPLDDAVQPTTPPPPIAIDPSSGKAPSVPPPPVLPAGVFKVGRFVALAKTSALGAHKQAKRYCEQLRAVQYLGIRGWVLPNPAEAKKLVGRSEVRKGRYWTTALHAGRALAISLPSGSTSSISSERGRARALCIGRWP